MIRVALPAHLRSLARVDGEVDVEPGPEVTLRFKRTILRHVAQTGFHLEATLPALPPGGGAELLLTLHALVVGLRQMADPAPGVAAVLALDEMAPLRIDFDSQLSRALRALIVGMTTTRRNP